MEARAFVLAVGLLCVSGQLYEGDDCYLTNGSQGECTTVEGCPGIREQFMRGENPKICSYAHYTPIVCCRVAITTTERQKPTTKKPKPVTSSVPVKADYNTKAGRMCKKYSRYVYWEVPSPVLTIPRVKYNETFCAMTVQKLIVGGVKADPMEFPHMAALGYGNENNIQWLCGGTLISERYVLTAGHCLASRTSGIVKWVRLGDLNLKRSDDATRPVTMVVQDRIRHPGYQPPAHYNDIALLRLQEDVPFSRFIRPACLYTKPGNPPRKPNVTATGWGKIEWTEEVGSDDLMKVDLSLQPPSRCNVTFRGIIKIGSRLKKGITADTMICAGDPLGKKDTCGGDSGGPLQVRLTDPYCMYSVIGLTSFGVAACGVGNNPAVYTRVSFYIPWIEGIVWPDQ